MEDILSLLRAQQHALQYIVTALIAAAIFCSIYLIHDVNDEYDLRFSVRVPRQCRPQWQGRILEEPSIKVSVHIRAIQILHTYSCQLAGSSAIQCYCPANGRFLGLVNPATPDGIERAIVKAKDAQRDWAKTTFKQRRQVLRAMLMYV